MGSIVYPMVGLVPAWPEFFKFILVVVLFNLAAAAICLFIGIVFKDTSVANLIGSLVMLFSLLFAGLLLNHSAFLALVLGRCRPPVQMTPWDRCADQMCAADAIPAPALWLQDVRPPLPSTHISLSRCVFSCQNLTGVQLSIFHYGFEALIVNEVKYLTLVDHKYVSSPSFPLFPSCPPPPPSNHANPIPHFSGLDIRYGLDIEVPGASILSSFGFDALALWRDVVGLAVFSAAFIVLAYAAMHILLVEKR